VRPWHFALIFGLVGACSGDILHSTDWASRCDADEGARDCDGSSSSSSSSSGEGGSGGESASQSSQSSSSAGGALAGGAGGGGAGGAAPCQSCQEVVQGGGLDPMVPMCPGSQVALDELLACLCIACGMVCATECMSGWTMGGTRECMSCVNGMALQQCPDQVQACLSN
jgi:hypothetical protein